MLTCGQGFDLDLDQFIENLIMDKQRLALSGVSR
jgi:hypothetical protein